MATDATVQKEAGEESLWTTSMCKYSNLVPYVLIDNWFGIETFLINLLSLGQTETQVDASFRLGSTYDFVWRRFACTGVDLR